MFALSKQFEHTSARSFVVDRPVTGFSFKFLVEIKVQVAFKKLVAVTDVQVES